MAWQTWSMAKPSAAARQLKAWRDGRPYTVAGADIGINPTVLSKIESGKYEPGRRLARRIAAKTGIPCEAWGDRAA